LILNSNTLEKLEMKNILNLSVDIDRTIDIIIKKWEYDILSSNKHDNIDMVSFLYSLLEQNAVVVIPQYKAATKSQNLNDNIHVIQENRHGKLVGVQGNSKTFSFNIKIIDMNVINEKGIGDIRCFRLTDPEGNWYKGIDKFQIVSTNCDQKLIENQMIGNDIKFDCFVNPARWNQFYDEEYFITKSLITRLKLEASNYYNQIKKMLNEGIIYPHEKDSIWPLTEQKGEKKLIKIFESDVFHSDYVGEFPVYESNQKNLVELTSKRNKIIYSIVPRLQFVVRAIEYAFFKIISSPSLPEELKEKINTEWKTNKIKRTEWKEFNLGNFGIRYRIYEKEEII
jgi:hypothetical protein